MTSVFVLIFDVNMGGESEAPWRALLRHKSRRHPFRAASAVVTLLPGSGEEYDRTLHTHDRRGRQGRN